ncbi:MAG TPA: DUF211 domain-containing protein [Candidatus Acidoferrales bacterium]|jgi:hypothetical protein|nr:DUF211 domain-containing protein [Candidatus Acidoferrales bacterium]
MSQIKRLVLDVLKPHEPTNVEVASAIGDIKDVDGVNLSLYEVDQQTENVKITVEGVNVNYDLVLQTIENLGGVVHSVDEIIAGKKIVEEEETLHDRG